MDPMLVLELEECRKNELCESRIFNRWEGKHFFDMVAYNHPQKFIELLWSIEVLVFAPSVTELSPKANDTSQALARTFSQVLAKKTIALHKKSDLTSLDFANAALEKKVIPRVEFSVEKYSKNGGIESSHRVSLFNVTISQFKGKNIRLPDSGSLDVVVMTFENWK